MVCGLAACGFGGSDEPSLSEVRGFDSYAVYYAGTEVADLPLEHIVGDPSKDDLCCTFIYGSCTPGPGSEGSCAAPLQIQVFSTCRRWFSALGRKRGLYDFRGAKATGGGRGIEASPIEIFTGRTTVVIWGDGRHVIRAAARRLREVNQDRPLMLPPPVRRSLWGRLPCQGKPG